MGHLQDRKCCRGPTPTFECGAGSNSLETHIIEILDEPSQIFALKTRNDVSILFPAEKVNKLIVKLRRSFIEVVKWFQVRGQDHRDV